MVRAPCSFHAVSGSQERQWQPDTLNQHPFITSSMASPAKPCWAPCRQLKSPGSAAVGRREQSRFTGPCGAARAHPTQSTHRGCSECIKLTPFYWLWEKRWGRTERAELGLGVGLEGSWNCCRNAAGKERLRVFYIPGAKPSASPAPPHLSPALRLGGHHYFVTGEEGEARGGGGDIAPVGPASPSPV